MIKSYLKKEENWDLNLGCLGAAYRSSIHESTHFTPNMMMFGREISLPVNLMFGDPPEERNSYVEQVEKIKTTIQMTHRLARENLKQSQLRQSHNHDVKIALNSYYPGSIVWYLNETRKPKQCAKLQSIWKGPFVVTRKISDLDYEIQLSAKKKKVIVHHDKLKAHSGDKLPNWVKNLLKSI